jgi:hypothetical protein
MAPLDAWGARVSRFFGESRNHTRALGAFVWSVRGCGRLRGGGDDGFVAGVADFDVVEDVDGAVFADFGFAGDTQGAIINVGRGGVAGQVGAVLGGFPVRGAGEGPKRAQTGAFGENGLFSGVLAAFRLIF